MIGPVELSVRVAGSSVPGAASWGAVLRLRNVTRDLSGAAGRATDGRMALAAVVQGLGALGRPCSVLVHVDSDYLRNCSTDKLTEWRRRGWTTATGNPSPDADLWKEFAVLRDRHDVVFRWIRGRDDSPDLARAARLAAGASGTRSQADVGEPRVSLT